MPKTPRPTDKKALPTWAKREWPGDPVRQKREIDAGMAAIDASAASANRNRAEMARRQNNLLGRGKK